MGGGWSAIGEDIPYFRRVICCRGDFGIKNAYNFSENNRFLDDQWVIDNSDSLYLFALWGLKKVD